MSAAALSGTKKDHGTSSRTLWQFPPSLLVIGFTFLHGDSGRMNLQKVPGNTRAALWNWSRRRRRLLPSLFRRFEGKRTRAKPIFRLKEERKSELNWWQMRTRREDQTASIQWNMKIPESYEAVKPQIHCDKFLAIVINQLLREFTPL